MQVVGIVWERLAEVFSNNMSKLIWLLAAFKCSIRIHFLLLLVNFSVCRKAFNTFGTIGDGLVVRSCR